MNTLRKKVGFLFLIGLFFSPLFSFAEVSPQLQPIESNQVEKVDIYFFERAGCGFCAKEMTFFEDLATQRNDFNLMRVDVKQPDNKKQFDALVEQYGLALVTPTTIVGDFIFQGFDSPETTGQQIINYIEQSKKRDQTTATSTVEQNFDFDIPFWGVVNLKDFSLFSLSTILGLVDGFNPCAMWVLVSFLLILWQIKSRKKMFQVVSIFLLAETIMYWLILNLWYKTWDFIALDKFITPAVGFLAIGGGIYFLYRYHRDKGKLVCETDSAKQSQTQNKIQELVSSPLTIVTVLGLIGVAFSVNVVEFACSIGIPQAFTKILEINELNSFSRQIYIFIYTFFYMIDDFIVFGLALYGFNKFYTVGQKYSNLSSLIGGILMIILGSLLLFVPNWLVF